MLLKIQFIYHNNAVWNSTLALELHPFKNDLCEILLELLVS